MDKKIIYTLAGVASIGLLSIGFIFMNNKSDSKEVAPGGQPITATIKNDSSKTASHSEKNDPSSAQIKTSEKEDKTSESKAPTKNVTKNTNENMKLIHQFISVYKNDSIEPNALKARETSLKDLMTPEAFTKSGISKETEDLIRIAQQYEKDHVLNTNTNASLTIYENVDSEIDFKNDHFEVTVNSEAKSPSELYPSYAERQRFTFEIKDDKISNVNIGEKLNTGA